MLKIGKDISKFYVHSYQPIETEELKNIIKERISKEVMELCEKFPIYAD